MNNTPYNPNLSGLGLPQPLLDALRLLFESQQATTAAATSRTPQVIQDTWVNRDVLHIATTVPLGSTYFATDRGVTYLCQTVSHANAWVYSSGVYSRTQAQLAALVATLTANDLGMRIFVSDFAHLLWCTGAAAVSWAPEDDHRAGEGPALKEVDPSPATGWKLYDGSTVGYLKSDGTTGSITLPDLVSTAASATYLKAGSPVSGPNAAVAPTLSGGAVGAAATGITASTGVASSGHNALNSSTTALADATHTHAVTIADPTHTHTLSGTVSADGEPRNLIARPWFRQ